MPQFPGSITDKQADAIVNNLFKWIVPVNRPVDATASIDMARSTVAAIICDAVSEDITLQPLHEAYGRKVGRPTARPAAKPACCCIHHMDFGTCPHCPEHNG
jgi:hypothetical protein